MKNNQYDVCIVGGGIIGCSTAYYLSKLDPKISITLVERDFTYEKASSTLSVANIRIQFSLKKNVEISKYAFQVFESFETDMSVGDNVSYIDFHRDGNLFIRKNEEELSAKQDIDMQKSLGCDVQWFSPNKIAEYYPLYRPENYAGGSFCGDDGNLDAYSVLTGYKRKAKSAGVNFIQDEVVGIVIGKNEVQGVHLKSGSTILSKVVINCAGAWAAEVGKMAGVELPVLPTKRQVFVLDTAVKPDNPLPLTVLPSGLYFRTETGGLIIVGKSFSDDKVGFDFTWDRERFFNILWPELADFVPAFDTAKLIRGWAGLYAVNSLDGNAILGEWPELRGFFLCNGFSGHGLQQGPAVGRYIAEEILGRELSLDLSIFGPKRILEKKPLSETGLV